MTLLTHEQIHVQQGTCIISLKSFTAFLSLIYAAAGTMRFAHCEAIKQNSILFY